MSLKTPNSLSPYLIFTLLITIIFTYFIAEINGLDESNTNDPSIKCGGCSPCGHPSCSQSPPPPPPPSPPPPSPPPPPKKPPSSTPYCPPPPSSPSSWNYAPPPPTGTAGSLYPVDPNYNYFSGAVKTVNYGVTLKIIIMAGFGLLQLLIMWM